MVELMFSGLPSIICAVIVLSVIFFIISVVARKNSIADIFWGLTFIVIALYSLMLGKKIEVTSLTVVTLVIIWGLRLAFHIYDRNKGRGEDKRYQELSKSWGRWFYLRSYLQVFLFQGLLAVIVSLPVITIIFSPMLKRPLFLYLGILTWVIGFLFESIGDYQLKMFIRVNENKGKILRTGLWKYTRHPNYFGEATMWWGIYVISLSTNGNMFVGVLGPVLITFLLTKVSGVPMLEKHMAGVKEWEEYKKETSVFIPWFPKKH